MSVGKEAIEFAKISLPNWTTSLRLYHVFLVI